MSNDKHKGWPDRAIEFFSRKKCKFWGSVFVPFIVCFKHGIEFFLWIMFVFLAGQLGTIINIVNRSFFQGWTLEQALYPDSVSGNFYTYALVLIASLIAPSFTRIKNKKEPVFRSMSVVFVTLLIFALLMCAVFFSLASQEVRSVNYDDFKLLTLTYDGKQLTFFILAIIFAWYSFGITLMADNKEGNEYDDDYLKEEQEEVEQIEDKSQQLTTDGNNTAI